MAKLPGGSRTVKSLSQVYQAEGLPALREPAAGETRIVQESGAEEFVQSLRDSHVLPRRRGKRAATN